MLWNVVFGKFKKNYVCARDKSQKWEKILILIRVTSKVYDSSQVCEWFESRLKNHNLNFMIQITMFMILSSVIQVT